MYTVYSFIVTLTHQSWFSDSFRIDWNIVVLTFFLLISKFAFVFYFLNILDQLAGGCETVDPGLLVQVLVAITGVPYEIYVNNGNGF